MTRGRVRVCLPPAAIFVGCSLEYMVISWFIKEVHVM
jgi:hypothetical protein